MSSLIETTKKHFLRQMAEGRPIYAFFPRHVAEVEKWALRILNYFPEADKEIVLLAVWLHDIGQADGKYDIDHAVKSQKEARRFLLKMGVSAETIKRVCHCVRAHRCRDVLPKILEAKIVTAADSASHMTDITYIVMMTDGVSRKETLEKLERDFRDKNYLPQELVKEVNLLYKVWKELIAVFPESRK